MNSRDSAKKQSDESRIHENAADQIHYPELELKLKQFAEALGLLAADGDFRLLFVVHFEHVAGFKPGHNFLDVMNVDEVRAVRAPKHVGVERGVHLFERTVIGSTVGFACTNGDEAVSNGGEHDVFRTNEEHPLLRFDKQLHRRGRSGWLWRRKLI